MAAANLLLFPKLELITEQKIVHIREHKFEICNRMKKECKDASIHGNKMMEL